MLLSPTRDEDAGVLGPCLDCEGFMPARYIRETRGSGPVETARRRWRWTMLARRYAAAGSPAKARVALILARSVLSPWFLGRSRHAWIVITN